MATVATRRWAVVLAVLAVVALATAGFVVARQPVAEHELAGRPASRNAQARVAPTDANLNASNPTDTSPAGAANQVPAQPAEAIGALLESRAAAVRTGDRKAWLAGLQSSRKAFVQQQAAVFDRIRVLEPRVWRYQVAGGTALPQKRRDQLGGAAWLAEVQLGYRLTDGTSVTTRDQYLTVVRTAQGWRIAADTDGPTARDVWDLGPVVRASSERCVVIGATTRRAQVGRLAAECDADAARVDRVWGPGRPRQTVLAVPASTKDLAALLPDSTGLDETAAVTIGPADGAADGVLVNGDAFDRLSALGRRVVVTHELVHVAVRATGARYAPTWLSEGFADHVAYAGSRLSAAQIAAGAVIRTRADGPPRRLPADADFAADTEGAEAAYDESWVAVDLISEHTSLKRFYENAAGNKQNPERYLDRALERAGLGGVQTFTRLWQARLRRLAE